MATSRYPSDRLRSELGALLSPESTSELLHTYPPIDWSEIATRDDLAALATKADLVDLRGDLDDLRRDLDVGLTGVRRDLEVGLADLRVELHNTLRTHTIALVGVIATLNGVVWATVTFGT